MISRRNMATVAAVTEILVPGDQAPIDAVLRELASYPPRAQRRFRWLFFATEWLPLLSGYRRRFRGLTAEQQHAFLDDASRRSPLRRLVVSFLKQLVYSTYISQPEVEATIGYTGECLAEADRRRDWA